MWACESGSALVRPYGSNGTPRREPGSGERCLWHVSRGAGGARGDYGKVSLSSRLPGGRPESEAPAGPAAQSIIRRPHVLVGCRGEVGLLWEVLADEVVRVLVGPTLLRMAWSAEVEPHTQLGGGVGMSGNRAVGGRAGVAGELARHRRLAPPDSSGDLPDGHAATNAGPVPWLPSDDAVFANTIVSGRHGPPCLSTTALTPRIRA